MQAIIDVSLLRVTHGDENIIFESRARINKGSKRTRPFGDEYRTRTHRLLVHRDRHQQRVRRRGVD